MPGKQWVIQLSVKIACFNYLAVLDARDFWGRVFCREYTVRKFTTLGTKLSRENVLYFADGCTNFCGKGVTVIIIWIVNKVSSCGKETNKFNWEWILTLFNDYSHNNIASIIWWSLYNILWTLSHHPDRNFFLNFRAFYWFWFCCMALLQFDILMYFFFIYLLLWDFIEDHNRFALFDTISEVMKLIYKSKYNNFKPFRQFYFYNNILLGYV